MSKKINVENLNRKIRECNANAKLVNMANESGIDHIKNGTMTEDIYNTIIDANVNQGNSYVTEIEYGKGYLDGYNDCQSDTAGTVLRSVTCGIIGVGIIKYRKEIKAYGEYIIKKLRKKETKKVVNINDYR